MQDSVLSAERSAVNPPAASMSVNAPLLELRDVGLHYDGREVLRDVSFSIRNGEVLSLLGPSGCGKTTLLNIIAGFLKPTAGTVLAGGLPVTGPGPDRGVVFQNHALYDWMSVRDNISFSLRCGGRPREERRRVGAAMARLVGLEGFESSYPYELSGGMRQRCGLARVLAANPGIMLMDEPFAAVDVQTREALQEEIIRIRDKTTCTIVFITHSIDEAVFLSDRVFLMRKDGLGAFDEFPIKLPAPRDWAENRLHADFLRMRGEIYRAMRK